MRQDKFSKAHLILYACGIIPVVWLALLLAPYMGGGLAGLVRYGGAALDHPFHIVWCEGSLKTVLIFLLCYALGIGVYLSTDRNYRRREEHGSARWGDPKGINRKYADKELTANKILTQNVAIGLDGRRHRRNLNVLVVGGSGAGKTRFYAKPNIMNANTSLIVLDCKGEILRDTGGLIEANGYDIKVLDLNNMEKSHCYNPFAYLRSDNDIQRLVTNLFKNTTPKNVRFLKAPVTRTKMDRTRLMRLKSVQRFSMNSSLMDLVLRSVLRLILPWEMRSSTWADVRPRSSVG